MQSRQNGMFSECNRVCESIHPSLLTPASYDVNAPKLPRPTHIVQERAVVKSVVIWGVALCMV